MARINLKKLIQRNKETAAILQQLIAQSGEEVCIVDQKGKCLLGIPSAKITSFYPIIFAGSIVGKVYGTEAVAPLIDLIQFLIKQEQERKKLGAEILDLYREVNLMYNFSQKLAETIDQAGIAKLTLEETKNLIASNGGVVTLFREGEQAIEWVAGFGSPIFTEEALTDQQNFYRQLMAKEAGGIINNHQTDTGTSVSILYSPLKVKNRILGMILLMNEDGYQFTAADLKLLSTLSLQSAAGIESAQLYEKNIKEARDNEAAIRVLHEMASRFVPNEFINFLGYDQITEVALGDNVEKEVTVFFSDIRGYTSLSENMTPSETFKFINAFNRRMGPIILNNQGFINQYLGDGIMAIFPFSPKDALKASIEIHKELHRYNLERQEKNRPAIKIGIGLHTGPLIMGITGDEQRLDATTISDTVNTAARIESLTKFYGVNILISGESLSKIQSEAEDNFPDPFRLRYLGEVQVKGKKRAIKIHECFDGDLPEMFSYKNKYLAKFDAAVHNFYKQNFSKTITALNQIVTKNPNDKTAFMFLKKANQLMRNGVNADWTGIEMMRVK